MNRSTKKNFLGEGTRSTTNKQNSLLLSFSLFACPASARFFSRKGEKDEDDSCFYVPRVLETKKEPGSGERREETKRRKTAGENEAKSEKRKKTLSFLSLACVSSLYPSSSSSLTPQPRRPAAASPQAPPTLRRRLRRLPRLLFRPRRPLLLSLLLGAGGLEPQNLSTSTSTSTSSLSFFFFIPVFRSPVLFHYKFCLFSVSSVVAVRWCCGVVIFFKKRGKKNRKIVLETKEEERGSFFGFFSLSRSSRALFFSFSPPSYLST